jgi:hypothetical protein
LSNTNRFAKQNIKKKDIEEFIDTFQIKIDLLKIDDNTAKNIFITRLDGSLREHVMLNKPQSLEEAYELARLKQSVKKNIPQMTELQVEQILETVNKSENRRKQMTDKPESIAKITENKQKSVEAERPNNSLNGYLRDNPPWREVAKDYHSILSY